MLRIVAGPDECGGGSCWNVTMTDTDGEWDSVASGGTSRGPRDSDNPDAWLAWVRRQVSGELRNRVAWSQAKVKPFGWSLGAGHAPHGIDIRIPLA